jgi:hypothetical protein
VTDTAVIAPITANCAVLLPDASINIDDDVSRDRITAFDAAFDTCGAMQFPRPPPRPELRMRVVYKHRLYVTMSACPCPAPSPPRGIA